MKNRLTVYYPAGSQVILRGKHWEIAGREANLAGAVGEVLRQVSDDPDVYRVKLPDGRVVSAQRDELSLRKQLLADGMAVLRDSLYGKADLDRYVIYRCVVGSRAYGLDHDGSDIDRRGIYLPPAWLYWSLCGAPEQLENPAAETCYWEMGKFVQMALRANPNILECLYTPLVDEIAPVAQELLDRRDLFLSRFVYQTYNGYVLSQFKKLEQDLRARGEIRWKHAMHLIRLLLSGITILREGTLAVRVETYRERLMEVRMGNVTWEAVEAWRLALHREFEEAYLHTRLPEQPDFEGANQILIEARQKMD